MAKNDKPKILKNKRKKVFLKETQSYINSLNVFSLIKVESVLPFVSEREMFMLTTDDTKRLEEWVEKSRLAFYFQEGVKVNFLKSE